MLQAGSDDVVENLTQLKKSQQKSVNSYKERISEHQKKLKDYKKNPDAYDNKNYLKNFSSIILFHFFLYAFFKMDI